MSSVLNLLTTAHRIDEPGHLQIYNEVNRVNPGSEWRIGDLLSLSVKLSPGGLAVNRYDSPVHTRAVDTRTICKSVANSAPSEAIAVFLEKPSNYISQWIHSSQRHFFYLAVAFESRTYKIYLFDTNNTSFLQGKNLWYLIPQVYRSSYIDCLEVDFDEPQRFQRPVYFKMRAPSLKYVLAPGFRPHLQIENSLLAGIPDAGTVIAELETLTNGLQRVNDPVIKIRYVPGGGTESEEIDRFCQSDYAISMNTSDAQSLLYLNDHHAEILALGDMFACREQVTEWLESVHPFNCFISYLGIGGDFITIYYKRFDRFQTPHVV